MRVFNRTVSIHPSLFNPWGRSRNFSKGGGGQAIGNILSTSSGCMIFTLTKSKLCPKGGWGRGRGMRVTLMPPPLNPRLQSMSYPEPPDLYLDFPNKWILGVAWLPEAMLKSCQTVIRNTHPSRHQYTTSLPNPLSFISKQIDTFALLSFANQTKAVSPIPSLQNPHPSYTF